MVQQPSIILLKEGTDDSQGIPQLLSNISACIAVVDCVKSTLGPRGMDKLIQGDRDITISNDGATIMALLDIVHPAAKTLVDIAKSQDSEVGDGTTSVVVLTGAFLNAAKPFIEDGVHPQIVRKFFRQALDMSIQFIESYAITYGATGDDKRTVLEKLAGTAMNSKLISAYKAFFAPMVVDAVMCLDEHLPIEMIGIKEVKGGAVQDSLLVKGVAFEKTFSYAGFEQQPKKIMNPKIVLLNMELELKSEKENAEVRISDPAEYQKIVDAEWSIIYDKLDKIVKSGATVVLSRLAIGDLATQYFADRDVFCAGRVPEEDLVRMAKACGGQVQTTVNDLHDEHLGTCGVLEEKQIGGKRFNVFTECPKSKTATIVLRGGAEQFIAESHRSLHDAIMIVRRAMKHDTIVPGGGAIEMALSKHLREHARTIRGKGQLIINEYAKALEVIPRTITENAGLDPTDVLNKLRQKHHAGEKYTGVDVNAGGVCNAYEALVWEPALIRTNALKAATEAAAVVLSVDETIRHPKSERDPEPSNPYPQRARPGGRR